MNSKKCPQCGMTNWSTASNCKRCQASLNEPLTYTQQQMNVSSLNTTTMNFIKPEYYKHSGKFSVGGLLLGVILSVIAAVILSFIYSYIIYYLPFVYLNFLVCIGFSIAVGFTTGKLLELGKVRSNLIVAFAGFLVGLISLYSAWAVSIHALLNRANDPISLPEVFMSPLGVWETILSINETGIWSIKGATPTGIFLWIIWGIEALIIIGGSVFLSVGVSSGNVFCERCSAWCEMTKSIFLTSSDEPSNLKSGHILFFCVFAAFAARCRLRRAVRFFLILMRL